MSGARPGWFAATGAVLRHDLRLLFLQPAAWVFLAAFLFLAGLFFTLGLSTTGEASLRTALPNLAVTLVFTLPLVTMRQLAEEARSGTLELLLTAPLPLGSLLVGKWLATVALSGVLLLLTFPFPLVLWLFGSPDPGVLATTYVGLSLCCAAFSAVGLFASSLTRDPMVAGVIGVAILMPTWLASAATPFAPVAVQPWLARMSLVEHLRSFAQGVLDTGDIAWFVLIMLLFLAWTYRAIESRSWR